MIKFRTTKKDDVLIAIAAKRANTSSIDAYGLQDAMMDLIACHCNGCPLDLAKLLAASDVNFFHDAFGIRANICRETGKLQNHFHPRHAKKG